MDKCKGTFLSDDPVADDRFGSREPLAQTLVDMFKSVRGGKTIGLVGPWGSGKSSVIRSVKEQLELEGSSASEYRLITFDAWAHEGDPLRRVFLETLEKRLGACGWLADTAVADSLACRTSLQVKEEGVRFTGAGEFALVVVILSAAALAFLGVVARLEAIPEQSIIVAAAIAAFLPVLVLLGFYLRSLLSKESDDANAELLGLLMKKPTTVAKTETRSAPDPTSVDFEELFHAMVEKALAEERRVLVLVVDNLDRIASPDAQAVWSTMRTFFDDGTTGERSHLRRLWLVVPFARDSIAHLSGSDAAAMSSALDKVFDLVLDVPPPISSSWREYFLEQLGTALPAHAGTADAHTIYRLYGLHDRSEWPLTPRAAKRFINKLVAVHRLRKHSISLPSQALFVLQGGRELSLTASDVLPQAVEYLVGEQWQRDYAALYYGLSPDVAIEVVIAPQLVTALEQGDTETLRELSSAPGFTPLLESVISQSSQDWRSSKPLAGLIAAGAIESLDLDDADHGVAAVWRMLRRLVTEIASWQGLNERVSQGLSSVVRHADDKGAAASEAAMALARAKLDEMGPDSWVDAIRVVDEALSAEPDARDAFRGALTVPGDGTQYLQVVLVALEHGGDESLARSLRPATRGQEVQGAVIEALREASLKPSLPTVLEIAMQHVTDLDVPALRGVAVSRFQDASTSEDAVTVLFDVLHVLSEAGEGTYSPEVETAFRDGSWSRTVWGAFSRGEHLSVARMFVIAMDAVARGFSPSEMIWEGDTNGIYSRILNRSEVDIVEHVTEMVGSDVEWLWLLLVEGDAEYQSFAEAVLSSSATSGNRVLDLIGPERVLDQYSLVSKALGASEQLPQWLLDTAGEDGIMSAGYSGDRSNLYRDILQLEEASTEFEDFVVAGLTQYSGETWKLVLEKGTCGHACLQLLLKRGRRGFLGRPLGDAILESIGPSSEADVRSRRCVDALDDENRRSLAERLVRRSREVGWDGCWLVASWGPQLAEFDVYSADATKFLDGLASELVNAGNLYSAKWLADVLTRYPAVAKSASGRAKRDLKRLLRRRRALSRTARGTKLEYDRILVSLT